MRILYFNTAHRWIGEAAGTELLARTMAARGHDVVMAVPVENALESHFSASTAKYRVKRIAWRQPEGKGSGTVEQFRATARLLGNFQPDIIHVGRGKEHWCAALLRPLASRKSRIVRTRHVVLPMRQHASNRLLFRYGTDALTAISEAAFAGIGNLGSHLSAERRRVVLGAVDTSRYLPSKRDESLRKELGADDSTILVGMLGRWQRVKGHDVFLEAISRVIKRHPRVRGVVAGRKVRADHPRLKMMHDEFGLEGRIAYLGMIEEPEKLIASLDIGVIASRGSEGFSRIAVEYFASGVPVVATRVGALPQILRDGEMGLLVKSEDSAAMAEAIGKLVEDAKLRAELSRKGIEEARTLYSPDRMAEEMERIYEGLL